jgi:hypothetical protein
MAGISDALREINNLKPGEQLVYTSIAKKHSVNRSTLSRAHRLNQVPPTRRQQEPTKAQQPTGNRSSQVYREAFGASLTTYKAYDIKFRILNCLTALL